MQSRIQDYGSPVVAKSLKKTIESLVTSAILQGMQFEVDAADRVRVNPGKAVTNQGVIIVENEFKTLQVINTSNPVDYTIYYAHVDQDVSGGAPATLTIQSGLLTNAVVAGVILGYVRYPGGAVPLSTAHFIQPTPVSLGVVTPTRFNTTWTIPIKGNGFMVTATSGGAITFLDVFDVSPSNIYLSMKNNGLSTGSVTITLPFKVNDMPHAILQMIIATDINTTVNPILVDSAGTSFLLANSPLTGVPTLDYYEFPLPRDAIQDGNSLVYVQLQMQMAVGKAVKLQAIGLNPYNLPV